jgi:hypothetical protein
MNSSQYTWKGERSRELRLFRPCECSACQDSMPSDAVGYLSGSDAEGNGFTVWIFDEAVFVALVGKLKAPVAPTFTREHDANN